MFRASVPGAWALAGTDEAGAVRRTPVGVEAPALPPPQSSRSPGAWSPLSLPTGKQALRQARHVGATRTFSGEARQLPGQTPGRAGRRPCCPSSAGFRPLGSLGPVWF